MTAEGITAAIVAG